jgi:glyoxylase-like metal-dependent hydrolase (beta-lactamase superfamily II)
VGDKIHILDTRQLGRPGIIAATALETNDGIALFDTGPESTFNNIIDAIRQAGFQPNDVRHVLLSHIHFDHAGAAWRFAELGATIYVHPRGERHLVDPAKLVESATRIFGADMERLWGRIAPVPVDKVRVLKDNDVVRVGQFDIRTIETPGHASHHNVYHWDDNIFGGDVAGVCIGNGPPIPPFVPPELHVESWLESIGKMRKLNASNIYLPHFGKSKFPVSNHFDALEERVREWSSWLGDKVRARTNEEELKKQFASYEHNDLRAGGASKEEIEGYETADPSYMAVSAATRYWTKYHPESVSG